MTVLLVDLPEAALTRREFVTGAAALVVLGACGQAAGPGSRKEGSVTVDHKYGSTEIPGSPRRVVTVGLVDHDAVLALGVKPVAITAGEWAAAFPNGVAPWAQDHLGNAKPEVLPDSEINFEKIAALKPDLITASYSGLPNRSTTPFRRSLRRSRSLGTTPTTARPGPR